MLKEKKVLIKQNTKEEYDSFTILGYYSSIDGAYKGFIREVEREAIMDENVQTLKDFLDKMKDIFAELRYTITEWEQIGTLKKSVEDEDDG